MYGTMTGIGVAHGPGRIGRRAIFAATAAMGGLAAPQLRSQGTWPAGPLIFVVPYPPAGGTDVVTRELAGRLMAAHGWTIVVENRAGAGGNVGLDAVAKAAPDGTRFGMGQTSNLAINPALHPRMPFDPLTDFAFVSSVASQPSVLVVAKASPFRSLADLVAGAKGAGLTAGNAGTGTVGHLAGELLALRSGATFHQVPYRGAAPVVTDLIAGRVDLFIANPLAVQGLVSSGDLRALAVTSAARMQRLPEVPTVAESGYPDFLAVNWTGLVAPARTPPAVTARLSEAVREAVRSEAMLARLSADGSEPLGSTPEAFRDFVATEHATWGRVIRDARIQLGWAAPRPAYS